MKATATSGTEFKPVTLTLTLTSQKEVSTLYALFNYGPVSRAVETISEDTNFAMRIRTALDAYTDSNNGVYHELKRLIEGDSP